MFFNKQVTCVVGPDDDVHMPRVSNLLDYEGELAIVIGSRCRHVPEDRAHEVIAGYTIANDLSVRDWQLRTPDDDDGQVVRHPRTARALARHSGRARRPARPVASGRSSTTSCARTATPREMIYDCYQQVAHLSEAFTLEPGDVIATGTPAGIGAVRQPFPEGLLKVGDVVRIEIDGIGELRNTVIEEPDGYLAPETEPRSWHGRADRRAARVPRRKPGRRAGDDSLPTASRASRSSTSPATASAC